MDHINEDRYIAVHMQSVVLDGDLKLLLQERIVNVQVGMDYKIFIEKQKYCMEGAFVYIGVVITKKTHA